MLVSSYWTHNGTVDALAFSPDGKYLVSASKDSYVTFWCVSLFLDCMLHVLVLGWRVDAPQMHIWRYVYIHGRGHRIHVFAGCQRTNSSDFPLSRTTKVCTISCSPRRDWPLSVWTTASRFGSLALPRLQLHRHRLVISRARFEMMEIWRQATSM